MEAARYVHRGSGREAVGATVAKEIPRPQTVAPSRARRGGSPARAPPAQPEETLLLRGTVTSFDEETLLWQLEYVGGLSESVGIDLLNLRLQRRHAADKVDAGAPPRLGCDAEELEVRVSHVTAT